MKHTLENEFLKVTVDSRGAELVSVVNKQTGAEMMWQADPALWNRHAPILFPQCGKVRGGRFTLDGKSYESSAHGFARDYEHEFLGSDGNSLRFVLKANEEILARFPRAFRFETTFTLEGRRLRHAVRVVNTGDKQLRFGLGYHPGFNLPFDEKHTTQDYELRFEVPQTPMVCDNVAEGPNKGFVAGTKFALVENSAVIPLSDRMFDADSLAMSELTAKTISIVEKDSDRRITLGIEGFPYVLLWSAATPEPLKFLCIEPWHNLQDPQDSTGDWNDKPCAAALEPGQEWNTHLDITFDR